MKKYILLTFFIVVNGIKLYSQSDAPFGEGEWLKFKMSYSGFLKAGNATLSVEETTYENKPVYHVTGKGWTTGAIKWFFKVEDLYESYFDKSSGAPYYFVRKIDEGGHTKNLRIKFNHELGQATVNDLKHKKDTVVSVDEQVQDMVSAYYFLRSNYNKDLIKVGDVVSLNMFFDEENYKFKLKFLGKETINTTFGKIKTLKFRPYVMAGRVFKEEESLTLWVSDDDNKIPLRIKADLAVGSLRADLEAFKGLKHSFKVQF